MNIYISKEREQELRRFSERYKKSMSSIIDEALNTHFLRYKEPHNVGESYEDKPQEKPLAEKIIEKKKGDMKFTL